VPSLNITYLESQKRIAEIAKVLPVVNEMHQVYKKWRKFHVDAGKSPAVAHKKASEIIRRDYPNFDLDCKKAGYEISSTGLLFVESSLIGA
jgi:hypothetical protein